MHWFSDALGPVLGCVSCGSAHFRGVRGDKIIQECMANNKMREIMKRKDRDLKNQNPTWIEIVSTVCFIALIILPSGPIHLSGGSAGLAER